MEDFSQLLQRAQKGDKNAFGEIYQLYYQRIYRYLRFNVKQAEVAQDICQETFLKAWKSLRSFKVTETGTFQAYLFRIARNLLIDLSRKKKEVTLQDYEQIETNEDIEGTLDKEAEIKKVQVALSKLEDIDRQIILLRFFEDMPSIEVAKIIGIKDGALRVRTHRIIGKLKDILEGL